MDNYAFTFCDYVIFAVKPAFEKIMLILESAISEKIIKHCKEYFPEEACGILAGNKDKTEIAYPMDNTDRSPESYFMDPREQLKTMKCIREQGLEMLAIYHSHSFSRAYPSKKDVELAFYPDVSYVIVSLADKKLPVIRSFKIQEGNIKEEEVRIE